MRPHDRPPLTFPVRCRDRTLDDRLQRDGYIAVPFLAPDAVEELKELWAELGPQDVSGIWSNVHALSPENNERIDDVVTRAFEQPAAELFLDGRLAGASFLVKGTGESSASTLHQDWNNVEEDIAQSVSIWCPLVDVDEQNGALQVLARSHRLRTSIRSLDTPSLYLNFDERLEPHLTCLPVRAGEAVLYAHNLFHGSKPNRSDEIRVSVVSGVLPHGARHVHYRRSTQQDDTFDVLDVDRRFFLEGIPEMTRGIVPRSASVGESVHVPHAGLTIEEVLGRDPTPR